MPFLRRLWTAAVRVVNNDGLELSGFVAYTTILAIFPFMIFLASLAGFLGSEDAADRFIGSMFSFMPSHVASTLAPAVREVLTTREGGLLTFGILGTMWAASSGIEALRTALNRAYEVTEPRPIWRLRLQSISLVVASAIALLIVSLSVIVGPLAWKLFTRLTYLPADWELGFLTLRYLIGGVVLIAALVALHMLLPHKRLSIRRVLPGAVLSAVLWLAGASLFSLYLGFAGDFTVTYGSLGGVIISLLFFYISAVLFIFGAEYNAAREGKTEETALETAKQTAEVPTV